MQTPIDIWQNTNISDSDFNPSIIRETVIGEHTIKEIFITTLQGEGAFVRTFLRLVYPTALKKPSVALYIPSTKRIPTDGDLIALADGIAIATFDYVGGDVGIGNSIYTGEFANLSYSNAKGSINNVVTDVASTCWIGWTRIARRVMHYLINSSFVSSTAKIAVIGEEEGAVIMWHISAFEPLATVGVSVLGYGFPPFKMLDCKDAEKIPLTEDNEKWISGISSQSVAQYVNIQILSLISSNNPAVSIERLADVIGFLKNQNNGNLSISRGTGAELSRACYNAMCAFVKSALKPAAKAFPEKPTVTSSIEGDVMRIRIKSDKSPSRVFVMTTGTNVSFEYRDWTKTEASLENKEEGIFVADIPLSDYSDKIYYYCAALYKDFYVSSLVYDAIFPHFVFKKGTSRVLFESRLGEDSFTSEGVCSFFLEQGNVHLDVGPCGINGITANKGSLIWYKLNNPKYAATEESLLQFDVAAKKEADITFKILKKVDGKLIFFSSKFSVKPSEKWTKLSLPHQEFKTDEFIVMKTWDNILKFKIEGYQDGEVLFNNFLFI